MALEEFVLKKRIIKGVCAALGCSKDSKGRELCNTCRHIRWRALNPVKYAYNNLKQHSKERKIPFDLSFEDFRKWCVRTKYIQSKGRHAQGYTIDRKNDDPEKGYWGYRMDNIRKLTNSNNIKKELRKRREKKERTLRLVGDFSRVVPKWTVVNQDKIDELMESQEEYRAANDTYEDLPF